MPIKTRKHNFRVLIEPRSIGDLGVCVVSDHLICKDVDKEYEKICEQIIVQIKRHIDGVGVVKVLSDTEKFCEFCGAPWTEDNENYNGGCCDKDEKCGGAS